MIKFKDYHIKTKLISSFQFEALSGAIMIAIKNNLSDQEIVLGLNNLLIPSRRLNIIQKGKVTIIDDSYNANLNGVLEDLRILQTYKGQKIVITGGLIELGKKFELYNRNIAKEMVHCDLIYAVELSLNHPLCDEIRSLGYLEKLKIIDLKSVNELIKDNNEEKAILILAKGNNYFLN